MGLSFLHPQLPIVGVEEVEFQFKCVKDAQTVMTRKEKKGFVSTLQYTVSDLENDSKHIICKSIIYWHLDEVYTISRAQMLIWKKLCFKALPKHDFFMKIFFCSTMNISCETHFIVVFYVKHLSIYLSIYLSICLSIYMEYICRRSAFKWNLRKQVYS